MLVLLGAYLQGDIEYKEGALQMCLIILLFGFPILSQIFVCMLDVVAHAQG